MKVYDLYTGLHGWLEAFLLEGYECVGFDIADMCAEIGHSRPDGIELILRDVRSIHGAELKDATCIVGSSPCQEFSYRAMPWKRAKALPPPYLGMELFNAQFRIQREASEAAGRHIPMVVENVRGAQKWVGRAAYHYGSFYLWGDVPALMPIAAAAQKFNPDGTNHGQGSWFAIADSKERGGRKTPEGNCSPVMWRDREIARYAHPTPEEMERHGFKVPGFRFDGSGRSFQSASVKVAQYDENTGNKMGGDWFSDPTSTCRRHGSKSPQRKAASAMIAKIPFPLSSHIAKCFRPAPDRHADCGDK